ncbi:MAG: DNA repair protein RecN, partial [Selenomonadaceae bacterium]|nr:DNA repair protein RecN [Selenomonadaceae bacterium]
INGADDVDMLFSANAGEEVQPLSKIASGGELSRIALAIKAINADRDDSAAIMVFDEIDTGLGGVTANAVAECIAKVAKYKQVLCITHLPQIACMADVHILIKKTVDNERTLTTVARLSETDRIKEIARMASGDDASNASMENARTMLMNAIKRKRMIKIMRNA